MNGDKHSAPDLINPVATNVWREIYRGRWKTLRVIQKAEFLIELAFGLTFAGFFLLVGLTQTLSGTLIVWGSVIGILLAFVFVLTRFVR